MYNRDIRIAVDKTLGYEYFIDKGHPLSSKTGRVYYHRHVLSLELGRWLKQHEHVHHIDGNKRNNDPDNLQVVTRSEHSSIHKRKLDDAKCLSCNRVFAPDKQTRRFCSPSCASYAQRVVANRPTKQELDKLLLDSSFVSVGKMYGVSDNTIRKWLR